MRPFHWVRLPPYKLTNTIWDTRDGGPPVEGGVDLSPAAATPKVSGNAMRSSFFGFGSSKSLTKGNAKKDKYGSIPPAGAPDASPDGETGLSRNESSESQPLDLEEIEALFGMPTAGGMGGPGDMKLARSASMAGGMPGLRRQSTFGAADGLTSPNGVTLLPVKRANNVEIALSRLRLSNDEIKLAILHPTLTADEAGADSSSSLLGIGGLMFGAAPAASGKGRGSLKGPRPPQLRPQLSVENVAALLGVLPSAEELELVRSASTSDTCLGRVERFFLCLDEIYAPEQRLRSIQVTQQFDERAERLSAHASSLREACAQLQGSIKLRQLLKLVLRVGNFINGASPRGCALGFRLTDLEKVRQVRSADQGTTLLAYIARLPPIRSAAWLKDLKDVQLPAVFAARGLEVNELRPELSALRQQFELADGTRSMLEERTAVAKEEAASKGKKAVPDDPLAVLLQTFCVERRTRLEVLGETVNAAEADLRATALWLAEPANSTVEQLLVPIAS